MDALKLKYPCVICQDVQAAPAVLSCTHSYCGACITDAWDVADQDAADCYSCPTCRCCVEQSPTFQRDFDQVIESDVLKIEPCEETEQYNARRMKGLEIMKEISQRGKSGSKAGGQEEAEHILPGEWFSFIGVVALVVIMIIGFSRLR
jgi:hypothetical protein